LLVVPVIALAIYASSQVQLRALRGELGSIEAQAKAAQEQQTKLTQAVAQRQKNIALEAEVHRLERLIASQRVNAQLLASGAIGQTKGFSESMLGFARQSLEGVWLTAFDLSGKDIAVEGRVLRAELVPQYIKRLASEPAFSGRDFAQLAIAQTKAADAQVPAPYLSFRLAAKAADARSAQPSDGATVARP
jgi:Tfp pilus assembly protein PilN